MSPTVLLLLVEDEPLIMELMTDALADAGFTVRAAASGSDALDFLGQEQDLSGLMTDVHLGHGPDGWDVAKRARELHPTLPVVHTTGVGAGDWPSNGVPKSIVLQKPYVPAQLITAISTLLNEVQQSSAG